MVEEHAEITKVFSRNRFTERFEEESVGRERISERRVEQVVDVPAGYMRCPSIWETRVSRVSEEVFFRVHRQGLPFHELAAGGLPGVGHHPSSPTVGPPSRLPWFFAVGGPPWVGPTPRRRPCGFVGVVDFLHRRASQFDQSCPPHHQSLPSDDWCPCSRWIKAAHDDLVKNIVMDGHSVQLNKNILMDGDSTRPSTKGLGIPAASRLPVVEGETLAVGVSTRVLGVMNVGSLRTEVFQSPESECLPDEVDTLGDEVWRSDGIKVFCTPLGSSEFVAFQMEERLTEERRLWEAIPHVPDLRMANLAPKRRLPCEPHSENVASEALSQLRTRTG